MAISSARLDSLPHNGYIVTVTNGLCKETHKDAYMPIFWVTVLTPFIGTIVAVLLFTMFLDCHKRKDKRYKLYFDIIKSIFKIYTINFMF